MEKTHAKERTTDANVKLTGYLSEKKYPESFRLVRYYDEEEEREFTFLTNAKHLNALEVTEFYKKRCLVELFTYGQNSPHGPVR